MVATGLAVMSASFASGEVRCSDSVRGPAGAQWNAFGSEIGEHYGRYRLHLPEAERAMARSLERYGQLSPVVVCRRQERYELIDGFKRLGATRRLTGIEHLSARLMEADERTVKAAIYGL